jgi:gliding motility-associated-like protein
VNILVHPKPDVSAGDDQTVATGSVVQLQATGGTGVVQWDWAPPDYLSCTHCADPASTPRKSMIYSVTGTDGFGCADTADVKITLVCSHGNVFIPNTFSPNDDGVNDIFYPRGRGVRNIIYLRVFNRWGQLVFEHANFSLNDKPSGWNGTFKGTRLPPGVYIYQASMVCDDEKIFELKGNITLLR